MKKFLDLSKVLAKYEGLDFKVTATIEPEAPLWERIHIMRNEAGEEITVYELCEQHTGIPKGKCSSIIKTRHKGLVSCFSQVRVDFRKKEWKGMVVE